MVQTPGARRASHFGMAVGSSGLSAAVFEFHEAPTQPGGDRKLKGDDRGLILVIDDDEDARAIYTTCLRHLGYRATGVATGEEGFEVATSVMPAVILMDAEMPGIGGIEATRRIKADPRTRACPIVVVTASGTARFEAAREAGCDAYFCKPFNVFALDTVIRLLRTPGATQPSPMTSRVVKECTCGEAYSYDAWLALRLCGRMHVANPVNTTVELRNCVCGSTLALPVETS